MEPGFYYICVPHADHRHTNCKLYYVPIPNWLYIAHAIDEGPSPDEIISAGQHKWTSLVAHSSRANDPTIQEVRALTLTGVKPVIPIELSPEVLQNALIVRGRSETVERLRSSLKKDGLKTVATQLGKAWLDEHKPQEHFIERVRRVRR